MAAELFSKETKGFLRDLAQESLQEYGPGVVVIFMNTGDRAEWREKFGEDLNPEVEGVPLVDDPRHPQNRVNLVYQSDFERWKQGKPIEAIGHMAKKGPGRRRRSNPQPESTGKQAESG